MTSERAQAYGRLMRTVRAVGPSELQEPEKQRIREAADNLFFSEDLVKDEPARRALADVRALTSHLVDSDRWEPEAAERLLGDLEDCGPLSPVR